MAGATRWKKTPKVITAIEAAIRHDVAGDPITGIRWTRLTTEKIATDLATLGIQVCPRTVARILKDLGYRLRVNHKRVAAGSGLDRDEQGLQHYSNAHELPVLADSGGSNSPRIRCFKYALQTRLVDPHRLQVTVCHYPSGASKWNLIDHRLFSEISKNWAGVPLRSYQTIVNHIRTTTTDHRAVRDCPVG